MLRDDINNALKEAMKAKDERKVSTLRLVNSTFKNADIEARGTGKTLSEADLLPVLQKMIKQRQESKELYEKGGRPELAQQEADEIAIITAYLPKQMSDAEMSAAIDAAIAETGAASMKDMGKVVGALKAKFAGQMDFAQSQRPREGQARRVSFPFPDRGSHVRLRCGLVCQQLGERVLLRRPYPAQRVPVGVVERRLVVVHRQLCLRHV